MTTMVAVMRAPFDSAEPWTPRAAAKRAALVADTMSSDAFALRQPAAIGVDALDDIEAAPPTKRSAELVRDAATTAAPR